MTTYYTVKDGYIEKSTPSKKVADKWGSYETTEENIVYGYDGKLYLESEVPSVPIDVQNEQIRQQRQQRYEKESDPLRLDYDEALARGEDSAETLKQQWLASKDKIREELPYVEGSNAVEER